MPLARQKARKEEGVRPLFQPDAQEQAALSRAAEAVRKFMAGSGYTPEALAAVAISEWIIARSSMSASRMNAELRFDLGDARMRGFLEAALPAIGANLEHLPADAPLFSLSKEAVTDVFLAGIIGAQEAAVAANESLGFPFDDEVPFG